MRNLIIVGLLAATISTSSLAKGFEISMLEREWSLTSSCGVFEPILDVSVPSTIIGAQVERENRKPEAQRREPYANPFFGRNWESFNPESYQKCPVVYNRQLDVDAVSTKEGQSAAADEAIYLLRLHGVNYRANITINGKQFVSEKSMQGGIRRYALDITSILNPLNPSREGREGREPPPSLGRRSRAGGKINVITTRQRDEEADLSQPHVRSTNQLAISLRPPVNPRGNDFAYSFLDWNPLPADFNGGLWRSVSLLKLDTPFTVPSDAGDDKVFLWSNGYSVTTVLGNGGKNPSLAKSIDFDIAIQCYPLATCQKALIDTNTPDDAQSFIAKNIVIKTNYPSPSPLSTILGEQSCRISTPFARVPTSDSSKVVSDVHGQPFIEGRVVCTVNDVKDPLLWYPYRRAYDFSTNTAKPHLFQLTISIANTGATNDGEANDGEAKADLIQISEPNKNFGLRQVVSSVSNEGSRQLSVNGEFILIAGGGWSPDLFMRVDEGNGPFSPSTDGFRGKLLRQLELTKHMGVNLIRLEGKWENELFFNLCDEMGIMVLAGIECCSSWQNWKQWDELMTEVAKVSVRDQLRRLTSHPAVVSFLTSSDEIAPPSVEQMYIDLYKEERLSAGVIPAACGGASKVSGPTGVKMSGPYSWVPPHYFLANSNGKAKALGGAWGFLSEGGPGESPMTFNAWKLTVPDDRMWEPSQNASLSPWWNAHAGNPRGKFGTLVRFTEPLNARFGAPSSVKEYLYKSQLMNYEGIRAMFEAYTRNKIFNATGVVQWMLNNAFPSNIWHLYDYYLYGGGGYYGAKAALRPIQMVFSYVDGTVALVSNDFNSHFGGRKGTAKRTISAEWFVYRMPKTRAAAGTQGPRILTGSGMEQFDANLFGHNTVVFMSASIDLKEIEAELGANETYLVRLVYTVDKDSRDDPTFGPMVATSSSSSYSFAAVGSEQRKSKKHVEDNWYWLSTRPDIVDWDYKGPNPHLWTGCLQWADFTSLEKRGLYPTPRSALSPLHITFTKVGVSADGDKVHYDVTVHNTAAYMLFGVQLAAYGDTTTDEMKAIEIAPSFWDDNYFMLMPNRTKTLRLTTLAVEDYSQQPLKKHVVVRRIASVTYNDIIAEKEARAASESNV